MGNPCFHTHISSRKQAKPFNYLLMSRRKNQIFNLSFLDLVTGALGAVIFLFIITPKGGQSASTVSQAVMYLDTTEMKIFGNLHDSLRSKQVGDTLFTVLVDYKTYPKPAQKKTAQKAVEVNRPRPVPVSKPEPPQPKPKAQPSPEPKKAPVADNGGPKQTTVFKGDAPSVPCKVSFEVNWMNQDDNVDFFVRKGNDWVYGGRKKDRSIGQWDSGKSRNRLFGNDLRTNQEAVRQFDDIIPGKYLLYAQFKESSRNSKSVQLKGLIYTKGKASQQRGETFSKTLPIGKSKILLGTVILRADGSYQFIKQ